MKDIIFKKVWKIISPDIKNLCSPKRGRPAKYSMKKIFKAVCWIMETGSQWKNLPSEFPPKSVVHYWFQKWSGSGVYDKIHMLLVDILDEHLNLKEEDAKDDSAKKQELEENLEEIDFIVDGSFVRSKCGKEETGITKVGKGSKLMAIVNEVGIPVSIMVTSAQPHESQLVEKTLKNVASLCKPTHLIGDKAYDSASLRENLKKQHDIDLVAPHKQNRVKEPIQDPKLLKKKYHKRNIVEHFFAYLQWARRCLIRYEKKIINFIGFVMIRVIFIILKKIDYLTIKTK